MTDVWKEDTPGHSLAQFEAQLERLKPYLKELHKAGFSDMELKIQSKERELQESYDVLRQEYTEEHRQLVRKRKEELGELLTREDEIL